MLQPRMVDAPMGRDLVALATQRPAFAVEPPALTRYVIFRLDEEEHPHLTPESEEREKAFYKKRFSDPERAGDTQTYRWRQLLLRVNRFLGNAHSAFDENAKPSVLFSIRRDPDEGDPELDFPEGFLPHDLERRSANESLFCVLCPGNEQRPRIRIRVDVHLETLSLTYMADQFPEGTIQKALEFRTDADVEALYRDFWETTNFGPWPRIRELEWGDTEMSPQGKERKTGFGERFAEFRGVVIKAGDHAMMPYGSESILFDRQGILGPKPPAARQVKGLQPSIQKYLEGHQDSIRRIIATKHGPRDGEGRPPYNALTEAVVCGMLDGHALYASPLARDKQIVRYFVAYGGASQSQLGRFVRRIHTMGELRLYALMDLGGEGAKGIRRAGQATRRLAKLVDDAMQSDKALRAAKVAQFSREHSEISRRVTGGIIYRTERAHHYAKTFKERLEDFRIVRIEGWQPYDAFVRRYLYQEYDLIAGVGRRFQALGLRIDRLMFLHQSQRADDYQTSLRRLVGRIRMLQDRAEDIAIIAGLYYGYQLISKVIHEPGAHAIADWIVTAIVGLYLFDTIVLSRRIRIWVSEQVASLRGHADRTLFDGKSVRDQQDKQEEEETARERDEEERAAGY